MRHLIRTIALWSFSLLASASVAKPVHKAVAEVRQAEIAFDSYTHEYGYTKGFYRFSTLDAVAFQPEPYPVHAQLLARLKTSDPKDAPSHLRWKPDWIVVSRSGQMAVDVGEWWVEGKPGGGWFLTLWQKQKDGDWKFALDTSAGQTSQSPDRLTPPPQRIRGWFKRPDDFAALSNTQLDPHSLILSSNTAPARATSSRKAALESHEEGLRERLALMEDSDLALSWGKVHGRPGGYYVRVYHQNMRHIWDLIADLFTPLPSPKK